MRADDDLASYVVARRPVLEEVLRRLGCPQFLLAGVVSEMRGRCRSRWARIVREDDVDVAVLGVLLVVWQDRRRASGWQDRAGVVLAEVAGLDERQVSDVLDQLLRARLRPTVVRTVGGLAAVAVVVGLVSAVWPGHADADRLPPAEVQRVDGLVDVAWWSAGLLRLPDVAVTVGAVRDLAELPGGAVYVAGDGQVVAVDRTGARTPLGTAAPGAGVTAAGDGSVAAWREPGGDLVVVALEDGREVGRVAAPEARPVAIDERRVYYTDSAGTAALVPGLASPVRISGLPLVDVSAGSRLVQAGADQVRLSRPTAGAAVVGTGTALSLSPDGRFALVRVGSSLRALDLLGGSVETGLQPGEDAVAARLAQDGTVVLVVDTPVGQRELRTCLLGTGECRVETRLSAAGDVPLLAH